MVSSIAVKRTQFADEFKKLIETENDQAMRTIRERAYEYFAENGFPTPQLEDWKYTNVAEIGKQAWTTGRFGFEMPKLDDDVRDILGRFSFDRNGFTALNLAFAEVAVVRIPVNGGVERVTLLP